jgi:hypothetical protein
MSQSTRSRHIYRLLDGGRSWGVLEISASRCGIARYHLAVFPPGTSRDERVLLRLWRTWPVWGTVAWLVLEIILIAMVGSIPALVVSTFVSLAAGAAVMAMAGPTRGRVRTLTVLRIARFRRPVGDRGLRESLRARADPARGRPQARGG